MHTRLLHIIKNIIYKWNILSKKSDWQNNLVVFILLCNNDERVLLNNLLSKGEKYHLKITHDAYIKLYPYIQTEY